jgi:RNA polymerase sigma factor (sigma-70 family)
MLEDSFVKSHRTTVQIAEFQAAATVASYRLSRDLRSDLIQEALLELWRKRSRFDENRGCWRTFAQRVIANKMHSIVRAHHCVQRHALQLTDLARSQLAPHLQIEIRVDVLTVLATVSLFDRRVAALLCEHTPTETCHILRVSRSTVYLAVSRLRAAFVATGFSDERQRKRARLIQAAIS